MRPWYLGACLALPFASCISAATLNPGLKRTEPTIEGTNFEPSVRIIGLERRIGGTYLSSYLLRTWVDRVRGAGDVRHQLYVTHYYSGDWKFWRNANDQDARSLEFVDISRDVGSCSAYGCSHTEVFGVGIPDSILRRYTDGYSVKAYAKNGETMVVALDAEQITKQISAVDRVLESLRTGKSISKVSEERGPTGDTGPKTRLNSAKPAPAPTKHTAATTAVTTEDGPDEALHGRATIGAASSARDRALAVEAFKEAQAFVGTHEWAKAEQSFQKAILYDGSVAKYHAELGSLMMLLRRWVDATASFSAAVLLDVDNAEYRRLLKESRARR